MAHALPAGYEYLDHTADVQVHSWGRSLAEAFEQQAVGMFGYMTDLATVDLGTEDLVTVSVSGHDLHSLLYNFLDELLFQFSTELLICKEVRVTHLDRDTFTITAVGKGEVFQARTKHPQGTEVKAITYSNMQIHETPERVDIYVILDI